MKRKIITIISAIFAILAGLGAAVDTLTGKKLLPSFITPYLPFITVAGAIGAFGDKVLKFFLDKFKLAPDTSITTRNGMLDLVYRIWIKGFLENKLYYDKELLPLELCKRVGSRKNPPLQNPHEECASIESGTEISKVFKDADNQLLILGEGGRGKTTLLLDLLRDGLQRARDHNEAPIPVVLNLSSWAIKRLRLEDWIVEELTGEKYRWSVSRQTAKNWVKYSQLLLLLDGLDEVSPDQQEACIKEVNRYLAQEDRSIVVCSRIKEYLDLSERLSLLTAVSIQPLSFQQIDAYLKTLEDVAGLRSALQQSEELRKLATTPLFLRLLILTYEDKSAQEVLTLVNTVPANQEDQLFRDYVEKVLQKEGPRLRAKREETKRWLAWLAYQLKEHHQTEFYLEQLQPDWLPTRQRACFRRSVALVFGLIGGLAFALVSGLVGTLLLGWPLGGLMFGLVFGLVGVQLGALDTKIQIEPAGVLAWSWQGLGPALTVGLVVGLVVGLIYGLVFGLVVGLVGALAVTLVEGFTLKQLTGRLLPNEGILRAAKNGLVFGLVGALLSGLVGALIDALVGAVVFGLVGAVGIAVLSGLGAAMKHYILRFWLWQTHTFPWRVVLFLNDTVDQLLLRKVGGGYAFRHSLLQDYFVSLGPISSPQQ